MSWLERFPSEAYKTSVFAHSCTHTFKESGAPGGQEGCCQMRSKREAKRWAKSRTEEAQGAKGERRKGYTISAGGSEPPGNVTMSSSWEHRALQTLSD